MGTVFLTLEFLSGYCNGDYRNMSGDQPQRVQSLLRRAGESRLQCNRCLSPILRELPTEVDPKILARGPMPLRFST